MTIRNSKKQRQQERYFNYLNKHLLKHDLENHVSKFFFVKRLRDFRNSTIGACSECTTTPIRNNLSTEIFFVGLQIYISITNGPFGKIFDIDSTA